MCTLSVTTRHSMPNWTKKSNETHWSSPSQRGTTLSQWNQRIERYAWVSLKHRDSCSVPWHQKEGRASWNHPKKKLKQPWSCLKSSGMSSSLQTRKKERSTWTPQQNSLITKTCSPNSKMRLRSTKLFLSTRSGMTWWKKLQRWKTIFQVQQQKKVKNSLARRAWRGWLSSWLRTLTFNLARKNPFSSLIQMVECANMGSFGTNQMEAMHITNGVLLEPSMAKTLMINSRTTVSHSLESH